MFVQVVGSKLFVPLLRRGPTNFIQTRNCRNDANIIPYMRKQYFNIFPKAADGPASVFSSESVLEFMAFYMVFPLIIGVRIHSYYRMKREAHQPIHLPPRYEYMNIQKVPFPWGDGKEPLFGYAPGRSPAEYEARRLSGLPMPDRVDEDIEEDEDEEMDWNLTTPLK